MAPGKLHDRLERAGIESKCKTQAPVGAGGRFTKDRFDVDPDADTVICPAGRTARSSATATASASLTFGPACAGCPLREECTPTFPPRGW
jgi:hypothetical protein